MIDPTLSPEWKALESHSSSLKPSALKDLLVEDYSRVESLSLDIGDLFVDFSKQLITDETIDLLLSLANSLNLSEKIQSLFAGEVMNFSENRPALHTALRVPSESEDQGSPLVKEALIKTSEFAENVRAGEWVGVTGKPITSIVNVGIGGSHLGPLMISSALRSYSGNDITCRFVSNIDPKNLESQLSYLEPESTLFIINSKSFTTSETIMNAQVALKWAQKTLGEESNLLHRHFVAVTANHKAAESFGILPENIFPTWDWVGGRFSVCSSVSLAAMIAIGSENFQTMLNGCHNIDEHFRLTELSQNIPALMGMIGVWNRNFLSHANHAIIPYSTDLTHFPSYLQQLEMESNGKQVREDGRRVNAETSPILLGGIGTDAQHSFFQLLHQGTTVIPVDFIAFCNPTPPTETLDGEMVLKNHEILLANCFAQSKALAIGSKTETGYLSSDGNRPSTTILGNRLDPFTLGQLIALYEHKVFTMGVLWQINSFDQWGVQLGKSLTETIATDLTEAKNNSDHDPSTKSLINRYQKNRDL